MKENESNDKVCLGNLFVYTYRLSMFNVVNIMSPVFIFPGRFFWYSFSTAPTWKPRPIFFPIHLIIDGCGAIDEPTTLYYASYIIIYNLY